MKKYLFLQRPKKKRIFKIQRNVRAKRLFQYPVFYFLIHKTMHNLFLTVYFTGGRVIASVTSGLAGFSGKKGLSPATARLIAKLLVEKFYKHSLVRRFSFVKYNNLRKFGFYFKRNLFSFLRKRLHRVHSIKRLRFLRLKKKLFFFKLLRYKFISLLRIFNLGDKKKYLLKRVRRYKYFYRKLKFKRKVVMAKKKSFSVFLPFFRAFKRLQRHKYRLYYLKVFSFGKFLRRFRLLIRKKGKKLFYRRHSFLHERARLYKVRKFYKNYKKIPLSVFFLNCYPDKTVKAAIRAIVSSIPLFFLVVSSIPIAHNGIRGVKKPRK